MRRGFLRPELRRSCSLLSASMAYIWSSIVAHLCFPVHGRAALASAPGATLPIVAPWSPTLLLLASDLTENEQILIHRMFLSVSTTADRHVATPVSPSGSSRVAGCALRCRAVTPEFLPLSPRDPYLDPSSRLSDLLASDLSLDAGDELVGQHHRCPHFLSGSVAAAVVYSHKNMTKLE